MQTCKICTVQVWCIVSGFSFFSSFTTSVLYTYFRVHVVYIKPGGVPDKLCTFPADEKQHCPGIAGLSGPTMICTLYIVSQCTTQYYTDKASHNKMFVYMSFTYICTCPLPLLVPLPPLPIHVYAYPPPCCILSPSRLRGLNLFEYVIIVDDFTERCAAYFMEQLLSALEYLHNLNIVHLAIKVRTVQS